MRMDIRWVVAPLAAALLTASGCAADPSRGSRNASNARAALESLKSESALAVAAPAALRDAEGAVRKAEAALSSDATELDHLGYLAEIKVELARAEAEKTLAQAELKALGSDRERLMMDARLKNAETLAREADARARAEADARNRSAALVAAKVQAPQTELDNLKVKQTERGMVMNLGEVLFSTGKAEIKAGATGKLDQLAEFLAKNPTRKIVIEGHTDSLGSEATNLKISQDRATSVKAYLMKKGVAPTRISAVGKGESSPVAENTSKGGRQLNRRVEIVISE